MCAGRGRRPGQEHGADRAPDAGRSTGSMAGRGSRGRRPSHRRQHQRATKREKEMALHGANIRPKKHQERERDEETLGRRRDNTAPSRPAKSPRVLLPPPPLRPYASPPPADAARLAPSPHAPVPPLSSFFPKSGRRHQMQVLRPHPARDRDLCRFHADDYIPFLRYVTPDKQQDQIRALKRSNVGEDCPVFDGLYSFCQTYAGASVGGAVKLNHDHDHDIAINWSGGLHHAKKKKCEASGFCYVNNIVLTILELLKHHQVEIHHANEVDAIFDAISYDKGVSALRMLQSYLGAERFQTICFIRYSANPRQQLTSETIYL